MATLTIKDLPDHVHARLRARAVENRRSLVGEAIACLEAALAIRRTPAKVTMQLEKLRRDRDMVTGIYVTERTMRQGRRTGRA